MATTVIMPRQGQSVESCLFSSWHVAKGMKIKKGDLLFSYETDKAAFDAESPADGVLLETFVVPGEVIPVLQSIAIIGEPGESIGSFFPGKTETTTPVKTGEAVNDSPEKSLDDSAIPAEQGPADKSHISPRARKAAQNLMVNYKGIKGSGPEGRIIEKDIIQKAKEQPKATPLARAIAYADQLNLPDGGSGAGGKIISQDLKDIAGIHNVPEYEEKPVPNIRRIIARNMHASLQNTAQLTLHTSADARGILELRRKFKKASEEQGKTNITINDLVCYSVVQSLKKHKNLNAHFLGETARYFNLVHLGFAVDAPRGLMVPTLRNAGNLNLEQMASGLKDLAARAQKGDIDPELLTGATFTVTNLGALGIEMFTPVLNPPQVGILGINSIQYKPADIGQGVMGFIPVIGLSLTFDHRAVDGAPAAVFLKDVADQIKNLEIK
jgi:pyruvate dehydrogenase E2 component (dihydrolipoamide acetyltransferase)